MSKKQFKKKNQLSRFRNNDKNTEKRTVQLENRYGLTCAEKPV
jgi:hypothetical protein